MTGNIVSVCERVRICVRVLLCVCVSVCTLFRAIVVRTGPSVGGIFSVSRGSAVTRPVKLVCFVLSEQTYRLFFKTTLELL